MLYIIIGLIVCIISIVVLKVTGTEEFISICVLVMCVLLLVGVFIKLAYVEAEFRKEIINTTLGTSYTTEDVIWASDEIIAAHMIKEQKIFLELVK